MPELDRVFVVPVDDCPSYACSLRVRSTRNNQRRGVRLAEDYALESWAAAVRKSDTAGAA